MSVRQKNVGGKGANDSATFPFHYLRISAFAASVASFQANPNGLAPLRILSEADGWALFKLDQLAFRLHSPTAMTGIQAVGYATSVPDTAPANVAAISELIPSTFLSVNQFVPTQWVKVPKKDLSGPFPWYKSVPGTADATEEAPGVIYLATTGGATDAFTLEIKGTITFKSALPTSSTPAALAARRTLHEERLRAELTQARNALLKVLSPSGGTG